MVELPEIQAGNLLDLLQTIHQGIPVDEQLSGRLGDVEVILEELVDREQRLLIERVDGVLLEDLGQENFTQGRRQLVDQSADAKVFIVDDGFLGVEDLADLDGNLRLQAL